MNSLNVEAKRVTSCSSSEGTSEEDSTVVFSVESLVQVSDQSSLTSAKALSDFKAATTSALLSYLEDLRVSLESSAVIPDSLVLKAHEIKLLLETGELEATPLVSSTFHRLQETCTHNSFEDLAELLNLVQTSPRADYVVHELVHELSEDLLSVSAT